MLLDDPDNVYIEPEIDINNLAEQLADQNTLLGDDALTSPTRRNR
jgi:hypothetical protein